MRVESLRIGMQVRHPQYGTGEVKGITESMADIQFNDGKRTLEPYSSGIEPAEANAQLSGLEMPLKQLIEEIVESAVSELGLEPPDTEVKGLARRWARGTLVMKPTDAALQSKEIPLETFFHKIVMVRNNLRVLEQKINAHTGLSDAEKVELQQYITRSYGSLTTFNILFQNKEDQFSSKA